MAKSKVEEKEVDSIYWNRITILLEILQQKTDFETTEKLVISLFEMLSWLVCISAYGYNGRI